MPTKTWKDVERKIAMMFGARGRTPLSGGNSGHTRSDTLHDKLFIEVKHRKSFSIFSLFRQVKELAKREGKIPLIVLHETSSRDYLVVCNACDVVKISEYVEVKE